MEAILLGHFISTGPAELLIASIWQGLLLTAVAWAALRLAIRIACLDPLRLVDDRFPAGGPAALLRHWPRAVRRCSWAPLPRSADILAPSECGVGVCAGDGLGVCFPVLAGPPVFER